MGMYTEMYFRAEVDKEAFDVIERLRAVATTDIDASQLSWPEHQFFKNSRAYWMMNAGSFYFIPKATFDTHIERQGRYIYYVTIRTDLKNYAGEIQDFFDWVTPHVPATEGFIGYSLYEEDREPTLYYKD